MLYPSADHQCEATEHRCPNGKCIRSSQVCDFTDNCGDGSDEVGCSECALNLTFNLTNFVLCKRKRNVSEFLCVNLPGRNFS